MNNDPEMMAAFLDEAGQYVAVLNERLLEAEGLDSVPRAMVDEMFRAAHSMKGTAGFLDLDDVCAVTHKLETVLDHVRKGQLSFTTQVVEALFNAFDTVSSLLVDIANETIGHVAIGDSLAKLDAVLASEQQAVAAVADQQVAVDDELCTSGDDTGIEHLGPLPAWLVGQLDELDVCEAIVALAGNQRVYALRFAGAACFDHGVDPLALVATIGKCCEIRRSLPLFEGIDSPWGTLTDYACDLGLLVFCPQAIDQLFANDPLPLGMAWELGPEVDDHGGREIGRRARIDLGQAERRLQIDPEMENHRGAWLSSSWEEMNRLDTELLAFEQSPRDMQHIDEVFRLVHSLKGSCATMGLNEMARIAHNAETLLDAYRRGRAQPDNDGFRVLFACGDYISTCLESIDQGKDESPGSDELDAAFERCFANLRPGTHLAEWTPSSDERAQAAAAMRPGQLAYAITLALEPGTPLPDIRYGMIIDALAHEGMLIASHPSMEAIEAGCDDPGSLHVLLVSSIDETTLHDIVDYDMVACHRIEVLTLGPLAASSEGQRPAAVPGSAPGLGERGVAAQGNTIRIDTARLDQMMNAAGELVITKARVSQEVDTLAFGLTGIDTRDLESALATLRAVGGQRHGDLIGRALGDINRMKQAQEQAQRLRDTILELHRHTSQMQSSIMRARMVPIGPLFQRFHRLVRDLCKERNRSARLHCAGETTELDKKLIDELADPLTHLVRNAIDHGMEDPSERVAAGKTEEGILHLDAFHEGGQIGIRLRDDGRGLDREKIVAKAVSNGLITAEAGQRMSDEDVHQLIFQPGFSTAAQVTNISGRGVGMDIVRSCINELKGSITIETTPGAGTTFTIRLPLTLAMIEALLVRVGSTRYAAPLESVREIVEIERSSVHTVEGRGRMIWLRDRHVSLIDPGEAIGIDASVLDGDTIKAVITKDAGETIALAVDQVIGQEEIVVKALPNECQAVRGISGATVLGDGGIALIFDVAAITDMVRRGGLARITAETHA